MEEHEQLSAIATTWPAITDADMRALAARLPQHAGPSPARVSWHSARPMAAACLAVLPDGTEVFVKRYLPSLVSGAELTAKHGYVNALVADGFPTVPQLHFADGRSWCELDDWHYEVSLRADGDDLHRDTHSWQPPRTRPQALEIGRTAARLRLGSEQIATVTTEPSPYQTRVRLMLGDPTERWPQWLAQRPGLAVYLALTDRDLAADLAVMAEFGRRLAPLGEAPFTWTHGDLHASNMTWHGDQVHQVIDFGLASPNPPLLDLAMAIERHAIDWLAITAGDLEAARPQVAADLVTGYRQITELDPNEADLLPDLVAVAQTEFALGVIDYAAKAPVSPANADWAYDVYFNAHNRWFVSDPGRRFADAVRQAATTPLEEM